MNLEGKTALVTGASRGIGRAIALELAKKGADVLLNYNGSVDRAREVKAEIERLGKSAQLYPCDVADYSACETMFRDIFSEHSGLDILVNNAGSMAYCPTTELTLEAWDKVVRLSITGYFLMARECAKSMIKNHYGRIINIASMYGRIASFHHPILAYNTTKGAVPNFTRGLAQEWAQYGITVNAIGPGEFPSEMMVFDDAALEELKKRCPIARPGKIEELCGQLLLFASENSAYTTGQTIYIDGGWTSV